MADTGMLPVNWQQGTTGWRWTPPEVTAEPQRGATAAQVVIANQATKATENRRARYGSDTDPGDISSHLLTLPSLTKWRRYWTEDGNLHMGGWNLRSVSGFIEDGA